MYSRAFQYAVLPQKSAVPTQSTYLLDITSGFGVILLALKFRHDTKFWVRIATVFAVTANSWFRPHLVLSGSGQTFTVFDYSVEAMLIKANGLLESYYPMIFSKERWTNKHFDWRTHLSKSTSSTDMNCLMKWNSTDRNPCLKMQNFRTGWDSQSWAREQSWCYTTCLEKRTKVLPGRELSVRFHHTVSHAAHSSKLLWKEAVSTRQR